MKVPSLAKNNYTYSRPNKKYMQSGFVFPGLEKEESIEVAVGIDTSGSISMEQLREVLSEVVGLMDMYSEFTLDIWQFDTHVYGYERFTKDTAEDIKEYELKGGGGTSFTVNWDFMKDNDIEPKLFIMFTDGLPYDSWGDPNYCDTIFIINNKYDKNIKSPFGQSVYYE
jgi:predicted metal-dependent peptidase